MPVRLSCSAVKRTFHGIMYQARWLMLFPKHAVDREYSFRLFTEKKSAKDFDDIVLRYEQDGKIVHRFIQVKHRKDKNKKISIGELLALGKDDAFGLIKYLIAYLKIKSSGEFEGEIEDFVIVTNADFDSTDSILHPVRKLRMMSSGKNKGKEISVIRVDTQDEFLDVGNGVRYKFDNSIISYLQENKDFIKRKVGREVSDKEIEDFLNKLVFAVNLPSGTELSEIIKSELGKEFSNTDAKHFFSRYQEEVLILLEKEEEEFLSYEQAKALFEKIREEILGAVWFGIIEPVASFTGRGRVLTALHNMLQRSAKKQAVISQVASISGLGGVGKSELARKYAYKYGKDYYGNVIWISAENSKTMESSFLDLAKDDKLSIPPQDKYENDKTIETIVKETYAFFARRGRKSLFIFDNAEGYKDVRRFLPSSLHPRHKKPYVLITSRNKDWGISKDEGEIKTIQLGVFKETEALKFVKRALNIRNNLQDEEIKNLTEELQYFPLALKQAVAYINEKNVVLSYRGKEKIGVSDYLKRYEEEAKKLLDFELKNKSDRYTKTTFITWKITIDAIAQKECGFEALSILEIMAYLAPDKIRIEEIFSKLIADDEEKLWNAVKLLDRYSMIDLKEGVANIHRLVQKVTRLKLQEKGREEEVLRKALELINSGNIAKDNKIHVASIWGYSSKHGELIDDFYFDSIYSWYGSTPLHLLAENDDYKAVKAILAHVEAQYPDSLFYRTINAKDAFDITLLHLAARSGRLNVVKCLVNKGANIHARAEIYQTPLYSAVKSGELDMVKYFISKGANIDTENWFARNLLYCAVESENFDIAEYLIEEKGIDVTAKYSNGNTLLHEVARYESLNALKYFVDKGIDVDIKGKYNGTLLHWAVAKERIDVVRYLIEQGADVNAKGNDDLIPLDWAVWHTNLKIVRCLVESGSDINAKSKGGWTSLHVIAKGNRVFLGDGFKEMLKVTEYLVQKGANVNAKNEDGNTPLHLAAMKGKIDVVKILLEYNADVNTKNNEGRTALYYAANNNHQELVELLLAHGASYD